MKYLSQIPTHVWLIVCFIILLIAYYIWPGHRLRLNLLSSRSSTVEEPCG